MAFDWIPRSLLAVKLHAYGLSEDSVTLVHSYLKRKKRNIKTNGTERFLKYFYQVCHKILC